ncbi:MAG: dNTP triphosphohydrolase [Planctomycetota bacterium]|nr:dNTP triphosphohydrolase [Planctomycetota bacterium]
MNRSPFSSDESPFATRHAGVRWPTTASYAVTESDWLGREHTEAEHAYRSPFQRDRDRIVHSAAFRRLQGKMQVFTGDFGDYHRTRLTHTLEVVSIARTLARVLELNEDLVEALGLLHDIGHPPFGHAGEDVLNEFMSNEGGFNHNDFALELIRKAEIRSADFQGLNLSRNILESQSWRSRKVTMPPNLECQVVDLADSIAYNAHDLDDALQMGLLEWGEVLAVPILSRIALSFPPQDVDDVEMRRKSIVRRLIDDQVTDAISSSREILSACQGMSLQQVHHAELRLELSGQVREQKAELEKFLFRNVYRHPRVVAARDSAQSYMQALLKAFLNNPRQLPDAVWNQAGESGLCSVIVAHIAGMTDHFCLRQYEKIVG